MSLNIVQIIPALETGGAERTVVDITRAVVDAGGRALTLTAGGRMAEEVIAAGGNVELLPVDSKNPWIMWRNVNRIANSARNFKASLIHARSRAPAFSAKAVCARLNIPFVTTYHGTYSAHGPVKRRYNAVMAAGDAVIANSDFIASHIIAEHGIDPARIVIIPRGVDPVFFEVPQKAKSKAMPQIVLPARFTRLKGHVLAIEALAILQSQGVAARLVFAGDMRGHEPYVHTLQAQITNAGLAGKVVFAGHITDMASFYTNADIVLCASTQPESFGRVTVEGQASARLCLAPNHGGSAQTISDGKTGFHFMPGNAESLANTLRRALDLTPDERAKICAAGKIQARRLYSRGAMCAKTLDVYDRLGTVQGKIKYRT